MTDQEKLELIKKPWSWEEVEDTDTKLTAEERAVIKEWLEYRDEYNQLTDIELAEVFLGGKLVLT